MSVFATARPLMKKPACRILWLREVMRTQEPDETKEETDDAVRAHCITLEEYDTANDEYDGYEVCYPRT